MTPELRCTACGRSYPGEGTRYVCGECGPAGILEFEYDYPRCAPEMAPPRLRASSRKGAARYLPVLPVASPESLPPLVVGATPLYRCPEFGAEIGVPGLWVKDEGRNPTASYKDRASFLVAARARELGLTRVTCASTGNAASSMAGLAASAGLECVLFVPASAPEAKLAQLLIYGARVLAVRGSYDQAFDLCLEATRRFGWYNRNTGYNPCTLEGKKTGALEIWEDLGYRIPDTVAVSVGDGCILSGLAKGFRDLVRMGLADRLPRLVGVQAEGSSVLARAFHSGGPVVPEPEPATYADSLSVGTPRVAGLALKAVRDSGGTFVTVSDEEIRFAQRRLARATGVFGEPAGAAPIAGLRRLATRGYELGDTVVAVMTGNGLKDVAGARSAVEAGPVPLDPDPASLEETVRRLGWG